MVYYFILLDAEFFLQWIAGHLSFLIAFKLTMEINFQLQTKLSIHEYLLETVGAADLISFTCEKAANVFTSPGYLAKDNSTWKDIHHYLSRIIWRNVYIRVTETDFQKQLKHVLIQWLTFLSQQAAGYHKNVHNRYKCILDYIVLLWGQIKSAQVSQDF